jgi:hypothetical protein
MVAHPLMNAHLQPWMISADSFPADGYACDQLEHLLGYGILAPSPHNTQPWRFRINATDVDIHADWSRRLRVVDPQGRELLMSCGAVLYNLRVAAEYFEKQWTVQGFPEFREPGLVARFHLGLGAETGSEDVLLFQAMTHRVTHRGVFKPDPVPVELVSGWAGALAGEGVWLEAYDSVDAKRQLADWVGEADRRQWSDREFRRELAGWVRSDHGVAEDGLAVHELGVRDWLSFAGPSLIRTFDRGKGQAVRDHEIAEQAPVLVVLGTERDDAASWVAAGQGLQSLLLRARSEEVWASFLCQPLEVPDLREQVAAFCGRPCPQVILRLGYSEEIPSPAPRRRLRNLLLRQAESHAVRVSG